MAELDISRFPPESVELSARSICLACVLDIFTRHMGLAAKTAHAEVARYTPSLEELKADPPSRPWLPAAADPKAHCPYCDAAARWKATFHVLRIESGKATDAPRRALVQKLPKTGGKFAVVEEKATRQDAFFGWLEKISEGLDLDDPLWIAEVSRHYLSRREPKTEWDGVFASVRGMRRSKLLEDGWESANGRLYLSPMLFDELLAVQYLVSRSHKAGGLTMEGRYTLPELFSRLRNSGYLRSAEVTSSNPAEALEQLVAHLGGGEAALRFYYVVDRRDYLESVKALKEIRLPRPRKKAAP